MIPLAFRSGTLRIVNLVHLANQKTELSFYSQFNKREKYVEKVNLKPPQAATSSPKHATML